MCAASYRARFNQRKLLMTLQQSNTRFRRFAPTRIHFDSSDLSRVRSEFRLASPFNIKRPARRDRQVRILHLPAFEHFGIDFDRAPAFGK
jgi:hypothetical protein